MYCPQGFIYRQESSHFDFAFLCLILVFSTHAPGLMEMYLLTLHKSNALEGNIFICAYVLLCMAAGKEKACPLEEPY